MTDLSASNFQAFLEMPAVRQITRNENADLIQRRQTIPRRCTVFETACTTLEEAPQYQFEVDAEARRLLPRIIDNHVQVLRSAPAPSADIRGGFARQRRIGIVFSGGPAPGGHNVIAGLFDAARQANPATQIFGFLMGPDGIIENEHVEITPEMVETYRNLGGFGMIKTGRTKIDTQSKMKRARRTCRELQLDALVIVGGDDSNTNAAFLAQEMIDDGVQVIGVPKTIDGDVQVRDMHGHVLCAMSFGFHSAARAFSQDISNLCADCNSDMKYWHICKVMGRTASHLALETALQTHANMTLIGEELANYVDTRRLAEARKEDTIDFTAYGMTLRHLSRVICNGIVRRAAVGKNCGVLVLPEGILEFINEIQVFILKLNTIIGEYNRTHDVRFHHTYPTLESKLEYLRRLAQRSRDDQTFTTWNTRDDDLFNDIPDFFQEGLLTERDSHGNFQFSQVETDRVIMGLVKDYLKILRENGAYKVGIDKNFYHKTLLDAGLDPDIFGPVLFKNYNQDAYLLVKESIISIKTLKQVLVRARLLDDDAALPPAVEKIYAKSVPQFKTQIHFYGYDGRGSNPTEFDSAYTYNLGWTVFNLIANGQTGQMAVIHNLEKEFAQWEPMGVPIAPLMHQEERQGKLALVLEKSLVNIDATAFKVVKAHREKWLAATPGPDQYRIPEPIHFTGDVDADRPLTLVLNDLGGNPCRGGL